MEEQLALIEKLQDIGIELTPEERLESIEEIEKFLQMLAEVDGTLERTRRSMLEGKTSPETPSTDTPPEDFVGNASLNDGGMMFMGSVPALIFAVALVVEGDTSLRIQGAIILLVYTVFAIWQHLPYPAISGWFRRRLVRSTKAYGQIVEAQAGIKKLSIKMKLKQMELLVKKV